MNARDDAQVDKIGAEPVEDMSPIELREYTAELLGVPLYDLPQSHLAMIRLLVIEVERERTRRTGVPWHLLRERRPDPRLVLPRGVRRLPE